VDLTLFTESKPGMLIPITSPVQDWAFVPAPLPPPSWTVSLDLRDQLLEATAKLGMLDGIGQTLPNPELLLRPLQEREALQSSALEGTYATPEELMLFAKNPREARSEQDPVNAWREVWNYSQALKEGIEQLRTYPLSLNVLKRMHFVLMDGVRGREKTPGEFRKIQVAIGSDRRFVPPPAPRLLDLLTDLERYVNAPQDRLPDLIRAFLVHYQFEAIHPFTDGNGRIGRAALAIMIYRSLGHAEPWLYLSAFFEKHKDEYIEKLFRVSTVGAWDDWISFCLRATYQQASDSIVRCKMMRQLREQYLARVQTTASARTHGIVEGLFASPSISVTEAARRFSVSYKTAKSDIMDLARAGVLRKVPDHYPTMYYAWELFRIAYDEHPTFASNSDINAAAQSAVSSVDLQSEETPEP
jgi:Fic family protein